MEIEEMMKQLAQGGITVQGDLVMKKEVQYEVSNVEAGGIGIQVVNGKEEGDAEDKDIGDRTNGKGCQQPTSITPPKLLRGPRKQFLFIEGDASWEKEGKQRNPSKENTVVRRREQDRFLKYLREHNLSSRELTTTQGDTLNDVVACFLVEWQQRGLVAKDFAGTAVWRFLKEECGMKSPVTAKAYGKEIKIWVDEKQFHVETLKIVREYF